MVAPDKNDAEVRLVMGANPPEQFSLVLRAVAAIPFSKDPKAKPKPAVQMSETSSITKVTAYRQVVEVTVAPTAIELKPGGEASCLLKFNRLHGYQGTVTVQLQGLPAGVTIAQVTVPEKVNEVKLTIKADKKAVVVKPVAATIRCTGAVAGVNLTTEAKVNVGVGK